MFFMFRVSANVSVDDVVIQRIITCISQILAWEKANGISGSEGTYEYFVDRVATIARDQQRTPVQWVEVFEHFGR